MDWNVKLHGRVTLSVPGPYTDRPPWRNRLARSAVNRKVGGSSPPGGDLFFLSYPPTPASEIKKKIDPGRIRTCNPLIRSQMPYPLGHRATVGSIGVNVAGHCIILSISRQKPLKVVCSLDWKATGLFAKKAPARFELAISCLLDRRFNQLSHGARVCAKTEICHQIKRVLTLVKQSWPSG